LFRGSGGRKKRIVIKGRKHIGLGEEVKRGETDQPPSLLREKKNEL